MPEPDGPMRHVTSPRVTTEVDALEDFDAAVGLAHADRLDHGRTSRARHRLHAALRAVFRSDALQVVAKPLDGRRGRRYASAPLAKWRSR